MPEHEYGRLWHAYRNAMAARLLRMHEEGPDGGAAKELVCCLAHDMPT